AGWPGADLGNPAGPVGTPEGGLGTILAASLTLVTGIALPLPGAHPPRRPVRCTFREGLLRHIGAGQRVTLATGSQRRAPARLTTPPRNFLSPGHRGGIFMPLSVTLRKPLVLLRKHKSFGRGGGAGDVTGRDPSPHHLP